ncbi:MAG TPA: response regulator, partial [Verrucomicrobiae bacterium]|nr:response regulator [Verrucomicrobiae bacterium]
PKMDGLQVIAIVRRKHPQLRTIIITGLADEQMRARAYAMGIDLYLEKPGNKKELGFLMDCIESLLDKEQTGGFRGVQSKSLVDLIQLECLSGSSSVLKIANGKVEAKIWIENGDVIDAETPDLQGEEAFKRILSWKTGNFEILPLEAERPRRINASSQGLLLDSVQALDEAQSDPFTGPEPGRLPEDTTVSDTQFFRKAGLGRIQGVEFAVKIPEDSSIPLQKWGLENPEPIAQWTRQTIAAFQALGEKFEFGPVQSLEGRGLQRQIHVAIHGSTTIAIGMLPALTREQMEQNTKKVLERWAS